MIADRVLARTDAVVVGSGLVGGIIATELAKSGVDVVALERGPARPPSDSAYAGKHDELRFGVRQDLVQDTGRETWTLRHHHREDALPIRRAGAFQPATGVGGSSGHYGALLTRFAPWEFELRSRVVERYGASAIPEGSTVQDWGITYDELEPYYDRMEHAVGVSSAAGNVGGVLRPDGNPFEGPRRAGFPLPPLHMHETARVVSDAARSLGWHPFAAPSGLLSREYTNPDGLTRAACRYCGQCSHYLCQYGAKADSWAAILPTGLATGRLEVRADCYVTEIVHRDGRATGVRYHDADGAVVEQPADVVVLSAYALNNTRLLLLSGMGEPYDPATGRGTVGRNYAYQVSVYATGFFRRRRFRSYMASGGGVSIEDFAGDNFDHAGLGFIGGATLLSTSSAAVIGTPLPPGSPRWGAGWQRAMREWHDASILAGAVAHSLSYATNHVDLDPTYTDAWGHPLLRITFDWHDNEQRLARFATERMRELMVATGADEVSTVGLEPRFDVTRYQSTHNTGGAVMGDDPRTSVVNTHLQMWDFPNVWVVGGSAFPQNGTPGPSGTIAALAYRAADGILDYRRDLRRLVDAA